MNKLSLSFPSSLKYLPVAEEIINLFLSYENLPEDDKYWTNLSIHELILNAIIHGNKWDEKKLVKVKILSFKKNLKIEVTDEGNCKKIPQIKNKLTKKEILKSHGKGLFIVKKIAEKIDFKILQNKNLKVTLKIKKLSQK